MSNEPESTVPESTHGAGHSILDEIGRRTGRVPRTSLHDTDGDDTSPILDPRVDSYQTQLRGKDRSKYTVVGEIASGGMGVVLRGHDSELGRDVAMKVVHAELADRPEVVERFVEEAQIGGQLQHPGIVPVYELGLMSDDRPYFTMKLVKGHTLAKLLSRRKNADDDRARFLSIFESVCQTLAYAHSKGVIHRDVKPANVMVGSFGEVQVVDWGLSKVLRRGGVADEIASRDTALSVIETVRSGPKTGSDSMVGNVLGTPAYMAPEQARGEIAQLDERTDVFALGAILCEILTGAAPYVEREGENLVQLAALAELDDARERIEGSSASPALKKLCLSCLMPAKRARPGSAEEVAEAVHEHLAGLESAAHDAQLAAAEGRVAAERSRRQLQLGLSAAALALVVGGGWWWSDDQSRARLAELASGFEAARAQVLEREREGNYEQAVDAAGAGLRLIEAGDPDAALLGRAKDLVTRTEASLAEARARATAVERETRFLTFLTDVEMRASDVGIVGTREEFDDQYRRAFAGFGIQLEGASLADRIEELRGTELALSVALGVDGWIRLLRGSRVNRSADIEILTSIALDLDDDEFRGDIRLALADRSVGDLLRLSREASLDELAPESFVLLNAALVQVGEFDRGRAIAVQGADRHLDHFLLQFVAGKSMAEKDPFTRVFDPQSFRVAEAYLRAAIALRPDLPTSWMVLGDHYRSIGDFAQARRFTAMVVDTVPDVSWDWGTLGLDYFALGDLVTAIEYLERGERALSLEPWQRNMLLYSRVVLGSMPLQDYIEWAEGEARHDASLLWWPAQLLISDSAGVEQDPERALKVLEPFFATGAEDLHCARVAATAHLLLGNGEEALGLVGVTERSLVYRDVFNNCVTQLIGAAARRLVGDDAGADTRLKAARRLRQELTVGREAEWSAGLLNQTFDQIEPIAVGG